MLHVNSDSSSEGDICWIRVVGEHWNGGRSSSLKGQDMVAAPCRLRLQLDGIKDSGGRSDRLIDAETVRRSTLEWT